MVAFFAPAPHYVIPTTMADVIKHLGVQSGIQLVVDAGDASCYPGSGQVVTDRSGNGTSMQFGSTTGSDADDPGFAGVAGRQSAGEYFTTTVSGSTWGFIKVPSPPAFYATMGKQNALFTFAGWVYNDAHDPTFGDPIFQVGRSTEAGISLGFASSSGSNAWSLNHFANGGAYSSSFFSGFTSTDDAWMFLALAFDEASGSVLVQKNSSQQSGSYTYSASPSENPSEVSLQMAAASGSVGRVNSAAVWNRKLTASEITSLYNATKTKFGQ